MIDNANKPPENRECPNQPAVSASANQREAFSFKRRLLMFVGVGLIPISILLERSGRSDLAALALAPFYVAMLWWICEFLRAPNKMTQGAHSDSPKSWVDKEVQPWPDRC